MKAPTFVEGLAVALAASLVGSVLFTAAPEGMAMGAR